MLGQDPEDQLALMLAEQSGCVPRLLGGVGGGTQALEQERMVSRVPESNDRPLR